MATLNDLSKNYVLPSKHPMDRILLSYPTLPSRNSITCFRDILRLIVKTLFSNSKTTPVLELDQSEVNPISNWKN